MILRIALNSGLALLAYYIGREMGRTEPIRQELREFRERRRANEPRDRQP